MGWGGGEARVKEYSVLSYKRGRAKRVNRKEKPRKKGRPRPPGSTTFPKGDNKYREADGGPIKPAKNERKPPRCPKKKGKKSEAELKVVVEKGAKIFAD